MVVKDRPGGRRCAVIVETRRSGMCSQTTEYGGKKRDANIHRRLRYIYYGLSRPQPTDEFLPR